MCIMASKGSSLLRCSQFLSKINAQRLGVTQHCRCYSAGLHNGPHLTLPHIHRLHDTQVRQYSQKNFFKEFIEGVRQDWTKNKELKENLKKFREETEKLEQSDALKKARQKYESIESETSKGSDVLMKNLGFLQNKLKETLDEAEKTEIAKKLKDTTEELAKLTGKAAETLSKSGEQISQSAVYKTVKSGVKSVKEEFDEAALSRNRPYRAPSKLRMRDELAYNKKKDQEKHIEVDSDATQVVMHKDSKWFQSWQNFKDNNQYVTKMFDLKTRFDESDHVLVRATRTFTDKVNDLFGGVFSKTEMSEVLTEIVKMDPDFDQERFLKTCQVEIIPNILESMLRGELQILEDWCHEAAYNTLAHPIKQAAQAGYVQCSRLLDISRVDVAAGKMMEQGPVLVITFNAQQIMAIKDRLGKVIEGDPDKIMRVFHVWALCRDQTILDPKAAWRLVDISYQPSEQWL